MKYMLLIYHNPATWEALPEEERNAAMNEAGAIVDELTESGEWIGGQGLADPSNSKTIRLEGGAVVVTDGPFSESKEQLAGYCLIECDSLDRAVEISKGWPDVRYDGVELRPLMDPAGTEM